MSYKITNHKLTRKLQALLTEDEVSDLNKIIMIEALRDRRRPVSNSAYIRKLVQEDIKLKWREIMEWNKDSYKQLKDKLQ